MTSRSAPPTSGADSPGRADGAGGGAFDVHAHVLLREVEELVRGRPGMAAHRAAELAALGAASAAENGAMMADRLERLTDVGARLATMDDAGMTGQLVSVSPGQYHPWADRALAADLVAAITEGVAAHCAQASDRLTGLGVVALQHPDDALRALDLALERGLRGVEICTSAPDPSGTGTVELSDPRLEPMWQRAEETGSLVEIHPFGTTAGTRLDRWYLSNAVGQPAEHAIALSHLIFGRVLDRHPGLRVLATHGGGYLPAHTGRMDHAWQARQDAHSCELRPSAYLDRLLVDSLVLDGHVLSALVASLGAERVLLGTDFPFDMADDTPLATLAAAGLDPQQAAAISRGNAERLGLTPGPVPVGAGHHHGGAR